MNHLLPRRTRILELFPLAFWAVEGYSPKHTGWRTAIESPVLVPEITARLVDRIMTDSHDGFVDDYS
jgi:hypothetical protein